MTLIGEKLTSHIALYKGMCIFLGRWPKETCTEGLAYEGPSCSVMATKNSMYFGQELPPLLFGDTSLKDSSSPFLIELSIVNLVGLRTPDNAASLVLIFWELLPIKVGQEWFGPQGNYCHDEVGRWCYFGG